MDLILTAHFFQMESANNSSRVLLFGTFDPLHGGHRHLFQLSRTLGSHLTVIVARDVVIKKQKNRTAFMPEHDRLALVAQDVSVDMAMLGDTEPASYSVLSATSFDILALGYDQKPSDSDTRTILDDLGLAHICIVRLGSHRPQIYKSSLYRR